MVKLRRVYESDLYLESKKDLDDLKDYLGDKLFDDYMKIRDKIPSPSDLNKKYPEFSDTDWDNEIERQFVKKYNTLIKDRIVHDSKEFKDAPSLERISSNNKKRYLSLYSKMRDFVLNTYSKYRDFSKLKKQSKVDVQDFVSNYISVGDKKKQDKVEGTEKLYEDSDWEVYKITSYPAAQLYGKGTKWCITGRYPGHEDRGQKYFDDYIEDNNLDGGYYFYISKEDPNEKYCVLQTNNGKIKSIWNAKDTDLGSSSKSVYDDARVSLPEVKEVNLQPVSDSYKNDFSLFEAISRDDLITIKSLLQKDVNLNKNAKTKTPIIFHAIDKGNPNIIELLLESGVSPNKKNNVGDTPLLRAAQWNDLKAIELLLKHKAKPSIINSNGGDLMYYACQQGMYKLVELLLKYKVDPNKPVTASKTKTSLQVANDYNYPDIVKLLKKYGAKE